MGEKEKILSKLNIKDYKSELELVLEDKLFCEEAKSLLLNVFYKLDNFYKDYQCVKHNIPNKGKFLEEYISIIQKYCNKIELVLAQDFSENSKNIVDKNEGSIICLPNENVLLYSVFELKENKLDSIELDFINKCIVDMLNKGNTINSVEPIRDFNGWSWNVEITNPKNMQYNIIFQNLLILFDYDFIEKNKNSKNIYTLIENELSNKISKIKVQEFMNLISKIAIILYNNQSEENHINCLKSKAELEKKIELLSNRREYINFTTKSNNSLIKKIEQIDIILNDYELVKKEFANSVLENDGKYFCYSDVVDKYETKRKILMAKIDENNKLLNPKEYLNIQEDYKNKLKLFDRIKEENKKVEVQDLIIDFQILFLEYEKIRLSKEENKKNLNNIISELRYYNFIPFEKFKQITFQKEINEKYEEVTKILCNLIIDERKIDLGISNDDLKFKIIKYIFETKIIKLENLIIKMNFLNDNKILVEYYDGNMLENKEDFEIPLAEQGIIKKNKKVKIF